MEHSIHLIMDYYIRVLSFQYGTLHLIVNGTVHVIFKQLKEQSIPKTGLMDCSISCNGMFHNIQFQNFPILSILTYQGAVSQLGISFQFSIEGRYFPFPLHVN
jgi:hypothetical protein